MTVLTSADRQQYGRFLHHHKQERDLAARRLLFIQAVRDYLRSTGYQETPVPVLTREPESAPITQFQTRDPIGGEGYFLRHSAEEFLRRLMVVFDRVFDLGPVMRAETPDPMHATEFVMLQTAARDLNLEQGIGIAIGLVQSAMQSAFGTQAGEHVDLSHVTIQPFDRAVAERLGLEHELPDVELLPTARKWLVAHGLSADGTDWKVAEAFMKHAIELRLVAPTVLTDFPAVLKHNSQVHAETGKAQRFSLIINGIECADGGLKLRTAADYRPMVDTNARLRSELFGTPVADDPADFYADIDTAPCDVITFGLGIDRVLAVFTGRTIHDLQLFPFH
ncbi:amino acid--tRNA ligase-related protein [Nocardia gamkensis]|uniref:amino acid--tRNA ligase-related protein n=1 Tax=Nocardia gamkensis TaxID=352869 RepID=UPI0036DFB2D3